MIIEMVDILVDWAFSSQHSIKDEVEKKYENELHRWPIIRGFKNEGYVWNENYIIVILRDNISNIPHIGKLEPIEITFDEPTLENIEQWQKLLRAKFSIRNQDFVMILPLSDGKDFDERWSNMSEVGKKLWRTQISLNLLIQHNHLQGFDMFGGFIIPPGYKHLTEYCQNFLKDNPEFSRNVFIMIKFDKSNQKLKNVEKEIRSVLTEKGFNPLRADDKVYPNDRDLWDNVCVYMLCCKQGIAVLENQSKQEFNPNVAIEYGYMRALNKRALLLADKKFPKDRADIVGKLRSTFDMDKPESTIRIPLEKWLKELD